MSGRRRFVAGQSPLKAAQRDQKGRQDEDVDSRAPFADLVQDDDLDEHERNRFVECYPSSIHTGDLRRALQRTMAALLVEIRLRDSDLALRMEPALIEIANPDLDRPTRPAEPPL